MLLKLFPIQSNYIKSADYKSNLNYVLLKFRTDISGCVVLLVAVNALLRYEILKD